MSAVTFQIWRGDRTSGELPGLQDGSHRRHGGAGCRPQDPGRAGERHGGALELQGGEVRFVLGGNQRHAEADVHDAHEHAAYGQAGAHRADEDVSADSRSGDGCELELRSQEDDRKVQAAQAGCAGWQRGACSRPMWIVRRNSGSASSVFCARMFATCCAITTCTANSSGRDF